MDATYSGVGWFEVVCSIFSTGIALSLLKDRECLVDVTSSASSRLIDFSGSVTSTPEIFASFSVSSSSSSVLSSRISVMISVADVLSLKKKKKRSKLVPSVKKYVKLCEKLLEVECRWFHPPHGAGSEDI